MIVFVIFWVYNPYPKKGKKMIYVHNEEKTEKYQLLAEIQRGCSDTYVLIKCINSNEEFELDKKLFIAHFKESDWVPEIRKNKINR